MESNEAKFEAYFSGTLSEEEIQLFNVELKNNEVLSKDYNIFLAIKKAAAISERDNLRTELANISIEGQTEYQPIHSNASNGFKKLFIWIGGIVLLSMSYFLFKSFNTQPEPAQLFAQNFEVYKVQSSRGTNLDELKIEYNNEDYSSFITSVKNVEKTAEINMMLAIAYIKSDQDQLAEKTLLQVSEESSLRDQKYWYLALLSLKRDNAKQAKVHLNKLQSLSNYKNKEIELILSKLPN